MVGVGVIIIGHGWCCIVGGIIVGHVGVDVIIVDHGWV